MKKAIIFMMAMVGVFLSISITSAEMTAERTRVVYEKFEKGGKTVVEFKSIHFLIHQQEDGEWFTYGKKKMIERLEFGRKDSFYINQIKCGWGKIVKLQKENRIFFPRHISKALANSFKKPKDFVEIIFPTEADAERFKKILFHKKEKRPKKRKMTIEEYLKGLD